MTIAVVFLVVVVYFDVQLNHPNFSYFLMAGEDHLFV